MPSKIHFRKSIFDSKKVSDDKIKELTTLCEAVCMARDLVNEPLEWFKCNRTFQSI